MVLITAWLQVSLCVILLTINLIDTIVQPGHLGVVYNRINVGNGAGVSNVVMREGLNFVLPWFQRPIIFDVRTRPKLINSTSGSKGMDLHGNSFPYIT